MKIGIIVYSQTGNTYSVAIKIKEALIKKGHSVEIDKIEAIRETKQNVNNIKISKMPDVEKYDGLIFASFVEAFSLCPVMDTYLKQLKSLNNKKIAVYVTQFFPYPWMGGKHAIKQMKKNLILKGNAITETGIVNWKNKNREQIIQKLVEQFTIYFNNN